MPVDELIEFSVVAADSGGVALIYSLGGGLLVASAWVLLLTLLVVLELTRGLARGALRAVRQQKLGLLAQGLLGKELGKF